MQKQTYIISDVESFEPKHIFDCGQCFLDGISNMMRVIQVDLEKM